ncbi:ComF family protein [Marinobacter sp.]|uniref:ComF family protein n=1 Tax=Marinobacter sp. TaxID=50741 RepID=UPI0034A2B520
MIKGLTLLSTLVRQKVNSAKTSGHCVACLDSHAINGLCAGCREDLPVNRWHCRACALPLAIPSLDLMCGECIRTAPPFSRTVAPWRYQYPVDAMIGRYKYRGQRKFARPLLADLSELLDQYLSAHPERKPELIIPAPMHAKRRRQRGFNQADEIAEALSRRLNIPWCARSVQRSRHARPQRELSREERLANLAGAFTIAGTVPRRVAIVDDVITTGATVRALTETLLDAGVRDVQVWALARTPG